jgi:hypothetical protein
VRDWKGEESPSKFDGKEENWHGTAGDRNSKDKNRKVRARGAA